MKLIPVGSGGIDEADELWVEKPGFPAHEASWIHPPEQGQLLPEYWFDEWFDKNRIMPPAILYIGSHNDCHVRILENEIPPRVAIVRKELERWLIEAVDPEYDGVYVHGYRLAPGCRAELYNGDTFALAPKPTKLEYKIDIEEIPDPDTDDDNWFGVIDDHKDFACRFGYKRPYRRSNATEVPEEIHKLAQETDVMRKRAENDEIRVQDWAAFAQYVKRHFVSHGIESKPWQTTDHPILPKPPPYPPRAYPPWIAEVLAKERQLPGLEHCRSQSDLPFASCLQASGVPVARPQPFHAGKPPDIEKLYSGYGPAAYGRGFGEGSSIGRFGYQPPRLSKEEALSQTFQQWLEGMDDSKFLMQYYDMMVCNFESLRQLYEIYCPNNVFDRAFFEHVGVRKLGHKRIFLKWFKEQAQCEV